MKKQSNLSRLLSYAGSRKILLYLSWIFSAISAAMALMPFVHLWLIIKQVIEVNPDFSKATDIAANGCHTAVVIGFVWGCGDLYSVATCIPTCRYLRSYVLASGSIPDCDQFTH